LSALSRTARLAISADLLPRQCTQHAPGSRRHRNLWPWLRGKTLVNYSQTKLTKKQ